jgi:hypothetical protein
MLDADPSNKQHGLKMIVGLREVEHRAAQHEVGESVPKGHCLDGLHPKGAPASPARYGPPAADRDP